MARVFVPNKDDLIVAVEDAKDGAPKLSHGPVSSLVVPAPKKMAVNDVPEHLRVSHLTGATRTFGFVNVASEATSTADPTRPKAPAVESEPLQDDAAAAELFAFLLEEQQQEGAPGPVGEGREGAEGKKASEEEEDWESF